MTNEIKVTTNIKLPSVWKLAGMDEAHPRHSTFDRVVHKIREYSSQSVGTVFCVHITRFQGWGGICIGQQLPSFRMITQPL